MTDQDMRPGEVAVPAPQGFDAQLYFIGVIRTPWRQRRDCPRRGSADGPDCTIELDPRWQQALQGLEIPSRIQVLYWMHQSRRDLVLQVPASRGQALGSFALRSPVRPNPIASSVVDLVAIAGCSLTVRGLDCIDGTPLLDLKPEHGLAKG
jgi:tRNA-Thr(GGU) m(6)t(6)A37 methyltransferase TsaA